MKTILYYFSGTGNTLMLARLLAEELGDTEIINIVSCSDSAPGPEADAIGILFPVYACGLPKMVCDFVKNSLQIKSKLNQDWSTELRYRQDYEGNHAWSKRSLYYNNRKKRIRKIIIGNYTARFGLGLTVGYRGGLLSKSDIPTKELFAKKSYRIIMDIPEIIRCGVTSRKRLYSQYTIRCTCSK